MNSAITQGERWFRWARKHDFNGSDEDNPEGVVHITERATWADQKKASKRVSALATALSKISQEKLDEFNLTPDVYAAVEESIRINNKGAFGVASDVKFCILRQSFGDSSPPN